MKVHLVGIDENVHAQLCGLYHECKAAAHLIVDKPNLTKPEQNIANDISNFLCSVLICDVFSRYPGDYSKLTLMEQLTLLKKNIKKVLKNVPNEDVCTNEENEIFSDLEHLYESLNALLK